MEHDVGETFRYRVISDDLGPRQRKLPQTMAMSHQHLAMLPDSQQESVPDIVDTI